MSKTIEYRRPDGGTVSGYLAEGPRASAPGIVVIQERWGVNDQIRGVADKLASQGYRALVPDLYRGKSALEANEAEHLMKGLDFGAAAGQDVRGAVQYLKSTGSRKVGVTGFCMGGALTLLAAVNVPEADAFVVLVRLSAAGVHRRVKDSRTADWALGYAGQRLPDREGPGAGGEVARGEREIRVPPLRGKARLCQ